MVKPLSFKGDKRLKKRKHHEVSQGPADDNASTSVDPSEDDSWSMPANAGELTGPTVIVLPTLPPTCLASDPNGNIFASQLENMIEGDPKTAEPHNVQQVWVASRVAGMAPEEISFKASHGGYLSCDQYGVLGAKREARGREETFVMDNMMDEDGRSWFQLRTAASKPKAKPEEQKYVSATTDNGVKKEQAVEKEVDDDSRSVSKKVSISLRGDGEPSSADTRVVLRMQTRFKPQTAETKEAARVKEKIGRKELEASAGRLLTDEEAKKLKRAHKAGDLQEALLDVRAKAKHDKYA
ncbi:hypothetical protein PMZ80_004818 [Knufia obscura]|uniref:Actin-crosslinking protein n=2 Tax=Knufia TaxID=430999 RepID=A0AAN8ED57_9EURO|nr:hypothetical protein PMZ80_004818 [Knufia obscura]KAK5952794.1 hypothetical protein OHC33_005913 [Knufia fluminis]